VWTCRLTCLRTLSELRGFATHPLTKPSVVDLDLGGSWEERAPHRARRRWLRLADPGAVACFEQLCLAVIVFDGAVEAPPTVDAPEVGVVYDDMAIDLLNRERKALYQPASMRGGSIRIHLLWLHPQKAVLEKQQLVLSAARLLPRREAEDCVVLQRAHNDAERARRVPYALITRTAAPACRPPPAA
jgi:hypothetical protein